MNNWYMMTVVGEDRPGIVARLTEALFSGGCNLGETSMLRLGGNFTIMMMVNSELDRTALQTVVSTAVKELDLRLHVDEIAAHLHQHPIPDVAVSVHGADRAGIIARVTGALAEAGLDILDLDSDVAGDEANPIYIMNIEGKASQGIEALQQAINEVQKEGVEVNIFPIETLIG